MTEEISGCEAIDSVGVVLRPNPQARKLSPEEEDARVEKLGEETARLKADDGEVLFSMRSKRLDSVVYAARDHGRLADYILKEWPECIGLHEPHERAPLGGKGESAAEIAIGLLGDYKGLLAEVSQAEVSTYRKILIMIVEANEKAKAEGQPSLKAEWIDEIEAALKRNDES